MPKFGARLLWVAMFTLTFSLMVVPVANAYIDPGSGSFVFQALIGSALAGAMAIKVFWRRVAAFLTGSGRKSEPRHADSQSQERP